MSAPICIFSCRGNEPNYYNNVYLVLVPLMEFKIRVHPTWKEKSFCWSWFLLLKFFNVVFNRMNTSCRYLFWFVILFLVKLMLLDMNMNILLFVFRENICFGPLTISFGSLCSFNFFPCNFGSFNYQIITTSVFLLVNC